MTVAAKRYRVVPRFYFHLYNDMDVSDEEVSSCRIWKPHTHMACN